MPQVVLLLKQNNMQRIFLIIFLISLSFHTIVLAQEGNLKYEMVSYTENNKDASIPMFNLQLFNSPTFTISTTEIKNTAQFFFDLIIGISIATSVIVFMYGAFRGILAGTSVSDQTKAKKDMQNSIVGLMIILSTWLIINTINPDLLRLPAFADLGNFTKSSNNNSTEATAKDTP